MTTYQRKSDGTLWRHIGTHCASLYPVELVGPESTIYVTKAELYDDFEEVVQ